MIQDPQIIQSTSHVVLLTQKFWINSKIYGLIIGRILAILREIS